MYADPQDYRGGRGGGNFEGGDHGGFRGGDRGGFRGGFRGGDRGGFRGGDRGGFRGGDRGGFRGGDRGGFRGGDRGGFRGGDRGGFRGGFRGGRGGFGGNTREQRDREENGISLAKENAVQLYKSTVSVETNCFPINVSNGKFHNYVVSYEFLENGKDLAGDNWKIEFQEELLRAIRKKHTTERRTATSTEVEDLCVCTGQAILSPSKLPVEDGFSIECKRKEKEGRKTIVERHYSVSIRYEGEVKLQLPQHTQWVTKIIACGLSDTYGEHVGSDYVDLKSTVERGDGLVTMDAVSPVVACVVHTGANGKPEATNVMQLDVSIKASTTTSCSDLIRQIMERGGSGAKRAVAEALNGAKVTTKYGEPTFLKVKSVDFDMKAGQPAKLKSNPNETFVDYFKRKYGANINRDSPMLFCRFADRSKCGRLLPYPADTLQLSTLNADQLTKLPMLCSIYPNERARRVKAALTRIMASNMMKTVLAQYGIRIETQALTAQGKVLPAPTIYVPTKGNNTYHPVNTVGYTGQAGFALELKSLFHPSQQPTFHKLLMDDYFQRGNIPRWLKEYNVAIPAPTVSRINGTRDFNMSHAGSFAMVRLPTKDAQRYNEFKQTFANFGIMSQMAVTDLTRNVPQMITQQVAAKLGQLCFVSDAADAGKAFANRPLLVMSAVVGSAMSTLQQKNKTVNAKLYTVAFVAFLANGKSWVPYCSHIQVKGEEQVTFEESDAASSSAPSTASPAGRQQNANEVLNEKFPTFLKEVTAKFGLNGKGGKGAVVLYRGAMTDAETAFAVNMEQSLEQVLPSWDKATVVVQPRSHFRMCWDPATSFPSAEKHGSGGFCNVPRGFTTTDFRIVFADADPNAPVESFYLSGANCTLGHASNTYYLVQKRSATIPMRELQQLTYNMCYMYPNKPDALPLPLPINCAYEYARKYGSLKAVKELPPNLRPTMHYL